MHSQSTAKRLLSHLGWSTLACSLVGAGSAATLYVSPAGNDANNGSAWGAAKRTVTAGLAAAKEGDEVRVAQGNYAERINLKRGVALLGGWSGVGTARDTAAFASVLDGGAAGVVVEALDATMTEATRIDGFVIQNGKGIMGGGVVVVGGKPTISDNLIRNNFSEGEGGGICCFMGASSLIVGNTIRDNIAFGGRGDGGGICCTPSSMDKPDQIGVPANPVIRGNRILYNLAYQNGGAICAKGGSEPVIEGNFILMNASSLVPSYNTGKMVWDEAGGKYVFEPDQERASVGAGGISLIEGGSAVIRNNIIAGNGGGHGGGILVYDARTAPQILNNTIAGNTPNGVRWMNCTPVIANNIVHGNGVGISRGVAMPGGAPVFANNAVAGNALDFDGLPNPGFAQGNLPAEPLFASARFGDYHLQPNSALRDAGSADYVKAGDVDVFGQARSAGARVDIGAVESDGVLRNVATPVIRVKPNGNDNLDGSTWANAKQHVAAAIAAAEVAGGAEIWVAQGTYAETKLQLRPYVYLYGGFAGTEALLGERSPAAHETILDAKQAGYVIRPMGGYLLSTIDGFTITGGKQTQFSDLGGGISGLLTGVRIENNVIANNISPQGGGIGLYGSTAVVRHNVIHDNKAAADGQGWGGGILFTFSTPLIEDNDLYKNNASDGGGIHFTYSKPWIVGNRIHDNTGNGIFAQNNRYALWVNGDWMLIARNVLYRNYAEGNGGGISLMFCPGQVVNNLLAYNWTGGTQGGGLHISQDSGLDGPLLVLNNTIVGSQCNFLKPWGMVFQGAGVCLIQMGTPNVVLANNIIAFNQTGLFNYSGLGQSASPLLVNNCVYGNVLGTDAQDYQTSYLQGGPLTHPTDLNVDPQFVNANAFDFHLQQTSPCVDAGSANYTPSPDLEGVPRPLPGKGTPAPGIELGAFERYNTALIAPALLTASDGQHAERVELAWQAVGNANSYEVWRSPTGSPTLAQLIGEVPGPAPAAFTDWSAVAGEVYTYKVKARLTVGELTVVQSGSDANYAVAPRVYVSEFSTSDDGSRGPGLTPYQQWRQARFTAAELANAVIGGDHADPDKDGLENLMEYALGCDPHKADSAGVISAVLQPGQEGKRYLSIIYRMPRPAPSDVSYVVEYSEKLVPAAWSTNGLGEGVGLHDGAYTRFMTPTTSPADAKPTGFLRLRVVLDP